MLQVQGRSEAVGSLATGKMALGSSSLTIHPGSRANGQDDAGIFAIDDDIYITSDFQTSEGTGGYYKNDVYVSLPPFHSGKDCRVKSIAKVGSAVVAGGWCHDEMNASNTGYWIISESSPVFKDLGGRTYGAGGHVIP